MRIPKYKNPCQWSMAMVDADLMFHPEDNAADVMSGGAPLFDRTETVYADAGMNQYRSDLAEIKVDPCTIPMVLDAGNIYHKLIHADNDEDMADAQNDIWETARAFTHYQEPLPKHLIDLLAALSR